MRLHDLSPELVIGVADSLKHDRDVNAFARTCWASYNLLNPYLYRRNVKYGKSSVLWWAVRQMQVSTVRLALSYGADCTCDELDDIRSQSLFSYAITMQKHRVEGCTQADVSTVFRLLVENGANINKSSIDGRIPLFSSVFCNDEYAFWALAENGVDLGVVDNRGRTALHFMVNSVPSLETPDFLNLCSTVDFLIKRGISVDAVDIHGTTPLHVACRGRRADFVRCLLRAGADPNALDDLNRSPLFHAVGDTMVIKNRSRYEDHASAVKDICYVLLDNGADARLRDGESRAVFHLATRNLWDEPLFQVLFHYGADVNAKDAMGQTPLHYAHSLETGAISCLLENGADVNIPDNNGDAPLHTWLDHLDTSNKLLPKLVQTLVDAGVDFDMVGSSGKPISQMLYESAVFSHLSVPGEFWDSLRRSSTTPGH